MCIFKRAAAFLLALLLVLNLPLAALAAEGDGTVPNLTLSVEDKPLKVGDEFVVTASLDATMTEPDSFGYNIQFDPAYVEFVSGESEYDVTEKVSGKAVNIAYAKPGEDIEIPAGEMAKLTFRAIQETEATAFALTDPEFLSLDLSNGDIASYDVNLGEAVSVSIAGEPGCGHNYVAGVCTECGEAEPGYVAPAVTVTLSLSSDDVYMIGRDTDTVMAFREITVPYFDLGLYGLEEYYFISETYGDDGDGMPGSDLEPGTAAYADGKVTLMHLYLYALEVFYCGVDIEDAGQGYLYEEGLIGTDVFTVSGGVGSSYMNQFWGGDCNLNYYVNYEYPLASGGWGATADQILLRDGDMVTLGHFSDWGFYGDPYSIFNYIVSDRETVTQGEDVTLTLYYAGASLGMTDGTAQNLNAHCLDVFCVPTDMVTGEDVAAWTYLGTSDENGQLVVDTADLEPGRYIVAVAGQPGEYTDAICSTPGGVLLTVEEGQSAPEEPESNDYVFYSDETGMAVPGDADITVTELSVKDGKDKIMAVDTVSSSATALSATIFLYETVQDGETFQMGYKAVGDDVDTIILENDTYEIGKLADIPNQPFPGIAQGTFKIKNASHMAVEIGVNFRVVKSFGLDQTSLTLVPGAEGSLSLKTNLAGYLNNYLANCVEWTTSDASVATVAGGKVTAAAPGTATVTATVGTKTASCEVTVASNDAVVFEGELALSGNKDITVTELFLKDAKGKVLASYMGDYAGSWPLDIFLDGDQVGVGDTFEFGFTAAGDDKDDACFRIITGYMGNTFTIASYGYAMGSMQIQDSSGTTSAMIRPNLFPVSNFGLSQSALTVAAGGEATLSATTSNGDVTSYLKPYVEWTTSDASVATVAGGKVTAVAPGTATITAAVGTKSASCEVTVAEPESNNYTVWTGEMSSQYSNLDLYVSEWYIEDGKPFVLGSLLTYDGTQYGNISTTTFVDADQIQVGDQIKMGAVVSGEDAETGLKSITGDVGTIASYGSFTQQMVVAPTDNYKITNSFNVIRLGDLVLDDVTMLDNENPTLTVTSDTLDRWGRIYLGPLVQWSSSDPEVITVEPVEGKDGPSTVTVGKLTAHKAGTATITAKVGNENISKTVTCTVTVECAHNYINGICTKCEEANPDYVAIETIALSSYTPVREIVNEETGETVTALPMVVGESEKLIVTVNEGANQGITWTSSDETVATVADGTVTAVGTGFVTITATAGGADVMTTFAMRNTAPTAHYTVYVEEAPASGYTLTMPGDISTTAEKSISVPVTVGSAEGSAYNAFDITVSYPQGLTLTSTEIEGLEVTASNGSVRVKGYGEPREAGTAAFTLTFQADAIGEYAVQVTSAKVDNSEGAIGSNAPDAALIDDMTVITIRGYDVTLPEEFTGASTVVPGTDYTFTIPADHYDYKVTVKIGDEVLVDGQILSGSYTIDGDKINGNIEVTMTREGRKFSVSAPAEHFPDAAAEAQFGVDYTAKLKVKINYDYNVTITIGGAAYTGYSVDEENYVFTIPGKDVTGEIVFTVTAEENGQGGGSNMRTVTFTGTGAGVAPVTSTSVVDGGSYSFSLVKENMEAGYTYTVSVKGEALTADASGVYTITNITQNITVTIEKVLAAETTVEVYDYVTKDGGRQVKLVLVTGTLAEGKVFSYNGEKMFYSQQYEAWAYLDLAEAAFTADTARAKVSTMDGAADQQTIAMTYDVNGSGTVDINDAQLAYDIYKPEMYTDFAAVSVLKFLNADINGSKSVTTEDAAAVVSQIQ